ncbi:uncharacterized protein LOC115452062 isoform X2 [Manduca sexta]|uniref:Uncharacterized protein n=2 Tax=Manduca sexta TaxID=7130 RepID=A0A921YN09_MANSE|nr:uncharacterized protein LOC115452062 isoform X2 [Manduca sexta]XP_030036388.1 uncharacterized protein LOC115452062 isoform X2 [Manduca sexta]XP_030036396.1 uncharacterized protein LOC115452062 isoform X2 [Manduca sexta]KAG6442313.1 hypothetical protein O3G_MSEX002321 [Manduca sexta]
MSFPSRRWNGKRRASALALVVLALGFAVQLPRRAHFIAEFPRVQPSALAHVLADYSHRHDGGAWSLEHEANNYTSWRYTVSYECGERCAGRAYVEAHEPVSGTPQHGAHAAEHLVRVRDQRCRRPPVLPWPTFCEEIDWVARVQGSAAGSRVEEEGTAWCSALRVLTGACGHALQEQLERRHQRMRLAVRA